MGFWNTNRSHNLGQKIKPYNNQQKTYQIVDFAVLADHRIKLKENEKKDKYFDLAIELKKLWNMKVAIIPFVIGAFGTVTKGLLKGTWGLGNKRTSGDHPNYYIIENVQNTENGPVDLRRLTVTQTPVKDHQLTLMWKKFENNRNNNSKKDKQRNKN